MAPNPRGRTPSAKTLVDRQLGRDVVHPVLPAGESFVVPNHSGDHSEGRVDKTPTSALDLVNKDYVDVLTTNHPHQDVRTTANPTFAGGDFVIGATGTLACNSITVEAGAFILPATDNSSDIGIPGKEFKDIRIDGKAFLDNAILGGGAGEININTGGGGTPAIRMLENHLMFGIPATFAIDIFSVGLSYGVIDAKIPIRLGDETPNYTELSRTGDLTCFGTAEMQGPKFKITTTGGYAIKLTNKTGGNTVAGQLVNSYVATAIDDAFKTISASDQEIIGIVLDAGIADGSEAWVVISGIADVLMDAGGSARGDRIISSATAGSGDVWNVGGAVATHFQEIGHCIETRIGAGLARCVLHFN